MIAPLFAIFSASLLVSGTVRDSISRAPLASVTVEDVTTHHQAVTDARGHFEIDVDVPTHLRFRRDGYAPREVDVVGAGPLVIDLVPRARSLEGVTVTALRAGDQAPISTKTIARPQIEARYFGQEVPLLLQGAPSVTSYAETANYWGYSYIRLRGIDQSRINLTLDGIPLNDPEDQVLYFADFPDLANSVGSVQIQRGVGTSSNGTASYAGSINFESIPLATSAQGTHVELEGGSFGTRRIAADYRSGLLPSRFAFYGRVSGVESNGYRYHSGVMGRSFFLSGGWFGDRDVVKVIATAGLLHDTLSYLAVPETALVHDRRINPLRPDELDRFGEQLGAVSYTRLLGPASAWSTTLYRISSAGNYDVAIDPDMWNYHLDFTTYGLTSTWTYRRDALQLDAGVNGDTYHRDHYAYIRPDLAHDVYFNTGHKQDASGFAKASYDIGRVTLFGDLQARHARFSYTPDAHADIPGSAIDWTFVNPKGGVSLRVATPLSVYASYGVNSREPARLDMLAGFDNLDTSNVAFVGGFSRVKPEQARDLEAGVHYRLPTLTVDGDAYAMRFHDEILPIGALSYQGLPLRKNVPTSYRRGVELDGSYSGIPRLVLSANASFERARIGEYTDETGDSALTYRNVPPLLTPEVLTMQRAELRVARWLSVAAEGRYTGESYLTNTGDRTFMLPSSYTLDGTLTFRVGRQELVVQANNLTNQRSYTSGYPDWDGTQSDYYVLPPRNFFVTARLAF